MRVFTMKGIFYIFCILISPLVLLAYILTFLTFATIEQIRKSKKKWFKTSKNRNAEVIRLLLK